MHRGQWRGSVVGKGDPYERRRRVKEEAWSTGTFATQRLTIRRGRLRRCYGGTVTDDSDDELRGYIETCGERASSICESSIDEWSRWMGGTSSIVGKAEGIMRMSPHGSPEWVNAWMGWEIVGTKESHRLSIQCWKIVGRNDEEMRTPPHWTCAQERRKVSDF